MDVFSVRCFLLDRSHLTDSIRSQTGYFSSWVFIVVVVVVSRSLRKKKKKHTEMKTTSQLIVFCMQQILHKLRIYWKIRLSVFCFVLFFFGILWTVRCAMVYMYVPCLYVFVQLENPCAAHFLLQTNCAQKQSVMRMKRKGNCSCARVCVCAHRDSGVDRSRSFLLDQSWSLFNKYALFLTHTKQPHTQTQTQTHSQIRCSSTFHFAVQFILYTENPKLYWEVDVKEESEKKRWVF